MYGLTIAESKRLMLQYIDEYSINGTMIPPADNADYLHRHNAFADVVQSSLAQLFPPAATYTIRQQDLRPLLAAGGLGSVEKCSEEDYQLEAELGGAYFCELAGPLTLFLEEYRCGAWQEISHFDQDGPGMRVYQGNWPGQGVDTPKRLRVTGAYPAVIQNAAIYCMAFATDEAIPDCRAWRRYEMPVDFMRLDELVVEAGQQYEGEAVYHWQNDRTLILPHDLTAQIQVRYWAYPPKLDEMTPDDYIYPLAPEVARLIPLKVAALVIPTERADLALRLLQLYEQELSRLQTRETVEYKHVQSVYRM